MTALTASAPGKAILFGEHAVVYGQPAIAVPIFHVLAKAIFKADIQAPQGRIWIQSDAIGLDSSLDDLDTDNPLKLAILNTLTHFEVKSVPALRVKIDSSIPVASGLGSGAAVSAAIIRGVAGFLGQEIADEDVSRIAYESEKLYHGTPSGIDNTVVSYGKAVWFEKGAPIELLEIGRPFTLLVADTGISSNTKAVVEDVRAAWKADAHTYEALFEAVGTISQKARKALRLGQVESLGDLMNENQTLLEKMGVSSPALEKLIAAARNAGVLGAKLSGGGRGGNLITLAPEGQESMIEAILLDSGAKSVIQSKVQ